MSNHVILVRHGQTEWNLAGRFQGHSEVLLSDLGIEQARSNGRRIGEFLETPENISQYRIVSSPLIRAQDTAKNIAIELGLNVESILLDSRLVEQSYGKWEGLSRRQGD